MEEHHEEAAVKRNISAFITRVSSCGDETQNGSSF